MTKDQRKRAVQSLNNQISLALTTLNYWKQLIPHYWGGEEFRLQAVDDIESDIDAIIALARAVGFKVIEKPLTMVTVNGNVIEVDRYTLSN